MGYTEQEFFKMHGINAKENMKNLARVEAGELTQIEGDEWSATRLSTCRRDHEDFHDKQHWDNECKACKLALKDKSVTKMVYNGRLEFFVETEGLESALESAMKTVIEEKAKRDAYWKKNGEKIVEAQINAMRIALTPIYSEDEY